MEGEWILRWGVGVGAGAGFGGEVFGLKEEDDIGFEGEDFFLIECGVEDGAWGEDVCAAGDLEEFVEVCAGGDGGEGLVEDEHEDARG